ncbi:hypothetical protein AGMMS49992_30640 [Clostridia bacterium]|nr:hypothetical protein AGMMS49992_30640 [Clostridia bacterium]
MALFKKKPVIEEQPKEPEDKTPAFLRPLYPYKAVGEYLDCSRLEDESYIEMNGVLYELHCPNPECVLNVRTQGVNLQRMYNKLFEVGCPSCKHKDEPFKLRRVVYVPEEVTKERMSTFVADGLTENEAAQKVADAYWVSGEYIPVEKQKQAEAEAKRAEIAKQRQEAILKYEAEKKSQKNTDVLDNAS